MTSSSDRSSTSSTSPSSIPSTVSQYLSHNVYGELDPPWLVQVLEFSWRRHEYFDHFDRRNFGQFEKFDLLLWLVNHLDPKTLGSLRRVNHKIKALLPDTSLFDIIRVIPRAKDPFNHLSKADLSTIGRHCRDLRILFDANPLRTRPLERGHDDGEDWKRILSRLPNIEKITLRTTKGPGNLILSRNIGMLTQPFRQNFQNATFLRHLTILRLVPVHVPYIVNFCSLGTDCRTEDWTLGKTWSLITELECQFYIQKEGYSYELEWEKNLQVLQRWLRGFQRNVKTLKFSWIATEIAPGRRPHPLALEKWLPGTNEFVESPIIWKALTTLATGNVELHEDDADSEINLLASRVPNMERYYRLKYATEWEITDFAFGSHEFEDWERFDRLANGRWNSPPGAERPRRVSSLRQPSRSQRMSTTHPSSKRSATHPSGTISRASFEFSQEYRIASAVTNPSASLKIYRQPRGNHTPFENSSTPRSGNTSRTASGFSQQSSQDSHFPLHSSVIRSPAQTDHQVRTGTSSRSMQHQRLEHNHPDPRAAEPQIGQSPGSSQRGHSVFERQMAIQRSQTQSNRSSGGSRAGSQQLSQRSPQSEKSTTTPSKQRFFFDHDDEDGDDTPSQQRSNRLHGGSREDLGFTPPKSPLLQRFVSPFTLTSGTIGTRTREEPRFSPPSSPLSQRFGSPALQSTGTSSIRTGSNLDFRRNQSLAALFEDRGEDVGQENDSLQHRPSRVSHGSGENSQNYSQHHEVPLRPQRDDFFSSPDHHSTSTKSRERLHAVTKPGVHAKGQFSKERGSNSRARPVRVGSVADFAFHLREEPNELNSELREASDFQKTPIAALGPTDSVSSKYSTPSAGLVFERRPTREATLETHEDPWAQKVASTRSYEQGNYVTVLTDNLYKQSSQQRYGPGNSRTNAAMASYDEFSGNPFVDEDQETCNPSGPCHRFSTPHLESEPITEYTGPLLPEEYVAISKRNGLRLGLALVRDASTGAAPDIGGQEQVRSRFDFEHTSSTLLENRFSAPELEQAALSRGRKAKRKHESAPVLNVRDFPPSDAKTAGTKTRFFRKVFKRRNSEGSDKSRRSGRESKASDGSGGSGKLGGMKERARARKIGKGVLGNLLAI